MRLALAALTISGVLATAEPAAADAIPADAERPDCPEGASGDMHSGRCIVMECGSAGQCGAELACRGAKLCVQEGRDGRSNAPELRANGACTRQADCESGWTCRTLRACVDDSGCNAGGALGVREGVVAVGAGTLIVLAAAARRRRTKR